MKPRCSRQPTRALTLFEVMLVLTVAVAAFLFVPVIFSPRHVHKLYCPNNLKQLGLGYRIWAGDNQDKYPMDVSTANGGVKEWMNTPDAWKAYLVMSNELSTPKILFCPEDISRGDCPTQWNAALKDKLSYFIGLDAAESNPSALLSGDGNFVLNHTPANHGFVSAPTNASLAWDNTRHLSDTRWYLPKTNCGYLGLCDGSVQIDLNFYRQQTGLATNRFFIP